VLAPVVLTHYRGRHRLGRAAGAASREHEPCGRAGCSCEIWLVHQPAFFMCRCQNGPVACFALLVVDGTVYDADVGRRLAGSVDHGRHEGNEPNMHPWCTEDVPGPTAFMDRGHREAPAVIVVGQWTGQEASALRQALRMTIPEFAERLGVAGRTVAKWEAHGSAIIPVPVMQAVLDTVLARAAEEAKSRFGMLLAANGDGVQYAQPGAGVLAQLGGATLAAPAPVPQRLDPEAIGRLRTILMEYVKIDNLLGPAHLLALMKLHLDFIGELLNVASGQVRTELLTTGACYAEFAGWLHQDAGNPQWAAYWTNRALGWARAADNPLIVSYVLMRMSNQASGLGDASRTLDLARAAAQAGPALTPCSRAGVPAGSAGARAIGGPSRVRPSTGGRPGAGNSTRGPPRGRRRAHRLLHAQLHRRGGRRLLDPAGTATPGGRHLGAWPVDVARALPAGPRTELGEACRGARRQPGARAGVRRRAGGGRDHHQHLVGAGSRRTPAATCPPGPLA